MTGSDTTRVSVAVLRLDPEHEPELPASASVSDGRRLSSPPRQKRAEWRTRRAQGCWFVGPAGFQVQYSFRSWSRGLRVPREQKVMNQIMVLRPA